VHVDVVDPPATPADEFISLQQIARALKCNAATVMRMVARGDLPAPLPLGLRRKRWLRSQLNAWWATVLGGQDGSPFPIAPPEPGDFD
jgi:excisionase family DNA binding protein